MKKTLSFLVQESQFIVCLFIFNFVLYSDKVLKLFYTAKLKMFWCLCFIFPLLLHLCFLFIFSLCGKRRKGGKRSGKQGKTQNCKITFLLCLLCLLYFKWKRKRKEDSDNNNSKSKSKHQGQKSRESNLNHKTMSYLTITDYFFWSSTSRNHYKTIQKRK